MGMEEKEDAICCIAQFSIFMFCSSGSARRFLLHQNDREPALAGKIRKVLE